MDKIKKALSQEHYDTAHIYQYPDYKEKEWGWDILPIKPSRKQVKHTTKEYVFRNLVHREPEEYVMQKKLSFLIDQKLYIVVLETTINRDNFPNILQYHDTVDRTVKIIKKSTLGVEQEVHEKTSKSERTFTRILMDIIKPTKGS